MRATADRSPSDLSVRPRARGLGPKNPDFLPEFSEGLRVALSLAEFKCVGEHWATEIGEKAAGSGFRIGVALQLIHLETFSVVPPNVGNSERRINGKLAQRLICHIDLDTDVRRRIGREIDLGLADDPMRIGHVETSIRLGSLSECPALPGSRPTRFQLDAKLVAKGSNSVRDETFIVLEFRQWAHDLESSVVVAHTQ